MNTLFWIKNCALYFLKVFVSFLFIGLILISSYNYVLNLKPLKQTRCELGMPLQEHSKKETDKFILRWSEEEINFTVYNMPSEFQSEILPAIKFWEENYPYLKITYSFAKEGSSVDPNLNAIIWQQEWEEDKSNEQARTTTYHVKTNPNFATIHQAVLRINQKNFAFSVNPEAGKVHLKSLLIHEFGHVLGFGHSNIVSIMNTRLPYNFRRDTISLREKEELLCVAKATYLEESSSASNR